MKEERYTYPSKVKVVVSLNSERQHRSVPPGSQLRFEV